MDPRSDGLGSIFWRSLKKFFATHWFVVMLGVVVGASWLVPGFGAPNGPLEPKISVHIAIAVAFFCSGLSLRTHAMLTAIGQARLHAFIQIFCFVVIPLLVWSLSPALRAWGFAPELVTGFTILSVLPTTIASAAIYTRLSGGNEAAALCNSILGNVLGVVLVPIALLLISGRSASGSGAPVILSLAREVVLPLLVGQALAFIAPGLRRGWIRHIPNACILFIVFCALCASWSDQTFAKAEISVTRLLVAITCLHGIVLALCWWGAGWKIWGFSRADRICALHCGSQKTLAVGLPILALVFPDDSVLGLMSLPMLIYHPIQLIVAAVLVQPLRRYAA